MRKADYQLLADIIRTKKKQVDDNLKNAIVDANFASGFNEALADVAEIFSDNASVDKEKFLIACGMN